MAITWRTLTGPSPADAIRPLEAAQRSFNAALSPLGDILAQRERTDAANVQVGQDAARGQYLDALQGARAMSELEALQSSGRLDELRRGMNPATQALVRGAYDERTRGLRDSITQAQAFDRAQQTERERPIRDSVQSMAIAGNLSGAREVLAQNPNMLDRSGLEKFLVDVDRGNATWDQTKKEWVWKQEDQKMETERHKDALKTNAASRAASAENASWARYQRGRAQTLDTEADRADALTRRWIQGAQAENADITAKQAAIAAKHGTSVEAISSGAINELPTPQLEALVSELKANNAYNPPTSTERQASLQKALSEAGIRGSVQEQALKGAGNLLRVNTQLSSEDAQRLTDSTGNITARFDQDRQNNLSHQDPAKRVAEEDAVMKFVDDNIQDNNWTKEGIKKGLGKILQEGITIQEPGKEPVTVIPSGRRVMNMLKQRYEKDASMMTRNMTDNWVREGLQDFYASEEGKKEYAAAQRLSSGLEASQKGALQREFRNSVGQPSKEVGQSLDAILKNRRRN